MDVFQKCYQFKKAKEYQKAGLYPYFIPLTGSEGNIAHFGDHKLIMCGSNNYLGLTTHPKVKQAAIDAVHEFGTSCTGSRFLNGSLELHERLEAELADWVGKDSALVFSTGMQVNLGTISALIAHGDIVILDREDHASIYDGARLGWGTLKRFRHNNMTSLKKVLSGCPEGSGKLLVVDGLYSMEGDIAPLPDIIPLCNEYGTRLMVDDAHSIGVLGKGKGTAAHHNCTDQVDLIMATFSKSFASIGGFIAGDEDTIGYIKHHARSFIFSASIPAANAAAALAALQVMREEPERIENINNIGSFMRESLRSLGFDIGNSQTPVIPIIIGDDERTLIAWKMLFEAGVFVNPILCPAVAPGRQLLRTSYMATHTDDQLNQVLETYQAVGKQLGLIN